MEGAFTMSSFIEAITTTFTATIGYISEVADTIQEEPILLFFCALPVVGIGVGMFKRLISVH